MAKTPTKVMLIGLDCALPHMVERYVAEGYLPTIKKLIEKGTFATHCMPPYPTVTPPNWATIGTGSFAGTHGVTDFHNHTAGTNPGNENITQNWDRERINAEFIWEAADKAGKKCVVLTYPGSAPTRMTNGVIVGGNGFHVGENRKGLPGLDSTFYVCEDFIVSTDIYPNGFRGEFADADGWEGFEALGDDPQEMEVRLPFPKSIKKPVDTTWWVLAPEGENGYEEITLATGKTADSTLCTLKKGQWSEMIFTTIAMEDGTEEEVHFRCKLIELADDLSEFKLLVGTMAPTKGWAEPAEAWNGNRITKGSIHSNGGMIMAMLGSIDLDTYVEMNENLSMWNAECAVNLLENQEWDLFYMHSHPIDWMYHLVMTDMHEGSPAVREKAWEVHRRIYELEDRMIERILSQADKDTLVVLVSDHGATPDGPVFDPYKALEPAGLAFKTDSKAMENEVNPIALSQNIPDYARSKAVPQREVYVYVNLKGRDPEGIVEPEDYEKVQREICDALLTYVDPETGKRPVALALPKREARILGLYGDRVGDVVYALYPEFGGQHGHMLPTAEYGPGKLGVLLVLNGPNVKKNFRMERSCWLWDVVPTICELLGFPKPETCEGAVLYQALKDPNFKDKELEKLREGMKRMEAAMARDSREPWDHHDCA
ncbi:putative AlkP superfamily phosphohydrolase/phosphomutase [Desulfobaculum xiamenense]|uniref:Putative AlkP superfamily phosphohydrolase/phosphomutase n=1 Tax=Desulfobaculum xiamenense TaxID=995050 RepID=A0A846QGR8_9BACT|nr:alkaline phosphatase family protein [Desulfobaculum xiamenense]NJB67996.1 putative AlkP superfamily phosphohydrolase/phosphomutase [Desulfobaculum xiamenense]